jgi:hypothetical protein
MAEAIAESRTKHLLGPLTLISVLSVSRWFNPNFTAAHTTHFVGFALRLSLRSVSR